MTLTSRLFLFTVRRLHFLSRIPGLPDLFDALLVALTALLNRPRLVAMELLEARMIALPGVTLRRHRYGGIEFACRNGRELGHLHGHGLLDVPLPPAEARRLRETGLVRPHHIFSDSGWVSYQLETENDVSFAVKLLTGGASRHGISAAPP